MSLTMRFYVLLTISCAIITLVSVLAVSAPPIQNPPRGPIEVGVGPTPEATQNKTELVIDIPDQTIDVRVTFRFNETQRYFIYVLLPYQVVNVKAYAIYQGGLFPPLPLAGKPDVGNFSTGYFTNTTLGSSIVRAVLDVNPSFPWLFEYPDMKAELAIGVSISIHQSLVAISDSFGQSQTAIFTFFGDVTGIWSEEMSAYELPRSQITLGSPFIVQLRLPPSGYYSDSQPSPIEYYVKQDQRWIMFSLDFLGGRYAQTLKVSFSDPSGQSLREIGVFLTGVFSTLAISFGLEVGALAVEHREAKQNQKPEPVSSSEVQQPLGVTRLIETVEEQFEKRFWFIYITNISVWVAFAGWTILVGVIWYLLYILSVAVSHVQGESLIPSLIGLVAALISFLEFVNGIVRTLQLEERYERMVGYNYHKMEGQICELDKPFLKALVRMKSKNPRLDLRIVPSRQLFEIDNLMKNLYA